MKAAWVALGVVLLLVMVFLAMTYATPALIPTMASSAVAGAPGILMATDPIETIAMHMHDGKLPVVY